MQAPWWWPLAAVALGITAVAGLAGFLAGVGTVECPGPPPPVEVECPPGHVPQDLTWPSGQRKVACTMLPPDPSHDW